MATSQDIRQMRGKMSDNQIFSNLYNSDAEFRTIVDAVQEKMPQMTAIERAKLPTYLIDRHYMGSFYPNGNAPTARTQNTMIRANTQQQELVRDGKMRGFSSLLEANPVEDASIGGFAENVLKSGGRLARDIGSAVLHPVETAKGIGKAALGGAINAAESITGNEDMFNNPLGSEDIASAIGDFYVQRYGGLDNLKKTAYEDPVGLLSDVASVITAGGAAIKGGASLATAATRAATKGASAVPLASTAAKVGKMAGQAASFGDDVARVGLQMEPVVQAGKATKALIKGAGKIGKFATSQVTGLGQDTIDTIARNPEFPAAKSGAISRQTLGEKVKSAITSLQDEVSDTGAEYKAIRESGGVTKVPQSTFRDVLKSEGLQFDDTGKIIASIEGPDLTAGEIGALNNFLSQADNLGETVTANQFLRLRERLTNLSKFEKTTRTSNDIERIAKGMRKALNEQSRTGIKGLDELDAKFGPMREELTLFEKEFIDPMTGELKPAAYGKIANLTGKGKEVALERVKKIIPGIENEVNALKAMEDVQFAGSQKVGSYMKGALGGFALSGGNPLGGIAGIIFATPSVSTKIIRAYGRISGIGQKTIASITGKLRMGTKLSAEEAAIMSAALQWAETDYQAE